MDFQGREWVESQDWFPWFDVLIDSTELGIRKPDPQPYLVAIEEMKLPAQDIIFIDDNPTYVHGGEAVGLQSLLLDVSDPGAVFIDAAQRLGLTD
jgi:putative hydrolase of the HAD superfamily